MNSLKLLLRFSYRPNTLGLCGRKEPGIYKLLDKRTWTRDETRRAENFARDLRVFHAYLKAVGDACKLPPFDGEVMKACIIGWDKWGRYGEAAAKMLKENLRQVALPRKLDEIDALPIGVPLTHNFHTLYFGAITSDIPRVLEFADRCKVSLGRVTEDGVTYNKLLPGLDIGEGTTQVDSPFLPVETGDTVFLHHGIVFEKASSTEMYAYERDLSKVLEIVRDSWEF